MKRRDRPLRTLYELWLICLVVSVGVTGSITVWLYEMRASDLVLDLCIVYALILLIDGRIGSRERMVTMAYVVFLGVLAFADLQGVSDQAALKTLLGMTGLYLSFLIFLVVRRSQLSSRFATILVVTGCLVVTLNQLGLTRVGEMFAYGPADLARTIGLERSSEVPSYPETTIAVWRALSVGLCLAAVVSANSLLVKMLGAFGVVLQFGGGGGGRAPLLFLALVPWFGLAARRDRSSSGVRLMLVVAGSVGLALLYLWAPMDVTGEVKGSFDKTHFERVTEVFLPLTEGLEGTVERGGLEGRLQDSERYWSGITSDARSFWIGQGLSRGSAFEDTINGPAHNVFLDVWGLTGLVGLSFWLAFFWYVLGDARVLMRSLPDRGWHRLLGLTYLIAVAFLSLGLLTQAGASDRSFMVVFCLLAGAMRPLAGSLVHDRPAIPARQTSGPQGDGQRERRVILRASNRAAYQHRRSR